MCSEWDDLFPKKSEVLSKTGERAHKKTLSYYNLPCNLTPDKKRQDSSLSVSLLQSCAHILSWNEIEVTKHQACYLQFVLLTETHHCYGENCVRRINVIQ